MRMYHPLDANISLQKHQLCNLPVLGTVNVVTLRVKGISGYREWMNGLPFENLHP